MSAQLRTMFHRLFLNSLQTFKTGLNWIMPRATSLEVQDKLLAIRCHYHPTSVIRLSPNVSSQPDALDQCIAAYRHIPNCNHMINVLADKPITND